MDEQKVVFIEDDPLFVEELKKPLVEAGYNVLVAPDGDAGVKLFRKEMPLLVILDLILPKQDGFEVLRQIKPNPSPTAFPKVVVITHVEDLRSLEQALGLGASTYIVKDRHSIEKMVETIKTVTPPLATKPQPPKAN